MNLLQKLAEIERTDPEGMQILRQLAANVHDSSVATDVRIRCLSALSGVLTPMMTETGSHTNATREKQATPSTEPRYETRYVRGAKTKVRIG
jgi:hypothetical protein